MKIAIPLLLALLLVGGFVANSNADVVSKTEPAPGIIATCGFLQ
jgi:hypothetical protein